MNPWTKTFYGWHAFIDGHRCAISRYRAGARCESWSYVARIDGTALSSPPVAHVDITTAKREVYDRLRAMKGGD